MFQIRIHGRGVQGVICVSECPCGAIKLIPEAT
jgi:hypothetical protein